MQAVIGYMYDVTTIHSRIIILNYVFLQVYNPFVTKTASRATKRGGVGQQGQQGQLRGPTFSWGPKRFDHYYIDELTQL